jgi:predicted ATPase
MLETVREFVAERLAARADAAEVARRHADHYRALAERADVRLRGVGHSEWLERLQAEAGNLAAAVGWYLGHDTGPLPHLSGSCGCSGSCGITWARRTPGSSNSCRRPTR